MERNLAPYNPALIEVQRRRDRMMAAQRERMERRAKAAEPALQAAQAKRDRRNAKRAEIAARHA